MKCPTCKTVDLVMAERHNVEIDYCPTCRGVWLDRGELDKILERAAGPNPSVAHPAPQVAPVQHVQHVHHTPAPQVHHQPPYPHSGHYPPPHPHYYKKKHKSWLGDILDFD